MTRLILSIFFLMILIPHTALAKGDVKVGDEIPHRLNVQNQYGVDQTFKFLARKDGNTGIVLVFVRSLDWCPYCQKQVIDLNARAGEFMEAGYAIVTVSYDSQEKLQKFYDKHKLSITLLSDPRSEIIKAFGLMHEEYAKGTRAYGIPHPAIYVVGQDKIVQHMFMEESYKDRPDINAVLAAIQPEPNEADPAMEVQDMDVETPQSPEIAE